MYHFLNGVRENLICGVVRSLHLVKVKPGSEGWLCLSKGLAKTQTLKILQLNNIELGQTALEALCEGIKLNTSIKTLDLSYCALSDKLAPQVARMLREQGELKDQQLWQVSLREQKVTGKQKVQGMI